MNIGRILISLGLAFVVLGLLAMLLSRANIPFGRLPGDLSWRGQNWFFSLPLGTSLVLSLFFTMVIYILERTRR
jgi:ribose/xylose/arabinose/galactoside ABC-type transport system permease subunit